MVKELPPARVAGPKPPLHKRPGIVAYWKHLAGVALGLVVAWWLYRCATAAKRGFDDCTSAQDCQWKASLDKSQAKMRPHLAKLHDAARAHMRGLGVPHPEGLDPVLASLLAQVDYRIGFEATTHSVDKASFAAAASALATHGTEVAPLADLFEGDVSCAGGIADAFEQLTGNDVIDVDSEPGHEPHIAVSVTIRASGTGYVEPSSKRVFPGIAIAGALNLIDGHKTLVTMAFDVAPSAEIEFSTDAMSGMFKSGRDQDVAGGLVEGACHELGNQLIAKLTGYAPAPPEPPGNDELAEDCESGQRTNACVEAGVAYRDGSGVTQDKARAATLFETGCTSGSLEAGAACIAAAELAIAASPQGSADDMAVIDAHARVEFLLEHGCETNLPAACVRLARWLLDDNGTPSPSDLQAARTALVRACDLHDADACGRAAKAYKELPAVAAVLANKPPGKQKELFGLPLGGDRVIAAHWAEWFEIGDPQVVVYVASKDGEDALLQRIGPGMGENRVRIYTPDELPYGVIAPAGTAMVWGATARGPTFPDAKLCPDCKSGEESEMQFQLRCRCLPLK